MAPPRSVAHLSRIRKVLRYVVLLPYGASRASLLRAGQEGVGRRRGQRCIHHTLACQPARTS